MKQLQKSPRKPLFRNDTDANTFVNLFNGFDVDENYKIIAKLIFVDGLTNEEVAREVCYSKRQIERIRVKLMKIALKKLIDKQTPKKGAIKYLSSYTDDPPVLLCPNCQEHIPTEGCNLYKYCYTCGQKLDWGDNNDR